MKKQLFILTTILFVISSCSIFKKTVETEYIEYKFNGIYEVVDDGFEYQFYNDTVKIMIDTVPIVSFSDFENVQKKRDEYMPGYVLNITLSQEAGKKFEEFTGLQINEKAAFILNDKLFAAPVITSRISGVKIQVTGADEEFIDEVIKNFKSLKK
ncbi:MAG: hypothetical protein JXL97_17965 [Bacteroidales bacterium]|nr:hypothetical protein [Bacteroidales bacterium]